MPPPLPETPPVKPWPQWYADEAMVKPGHILFSGPTQSGKTVLCREVARLRSFVVVFGTKAVDPSLTAYVDEGYTRIDHWPPTRHDMRQWSAEEARFILWPKIKNRADLRRHKPLYAKAMDDIFIDGDWTIVVDEGLWLASTSGLNLGQALGDVAYGAASNGVKLFLLVQRPSNVPPVAWTSVSQALLFHSGRTDDMRELASLGTYEPKTVIPAIRGLKGHQFLDLPCRGGAEWSISEVEV